MATVPRAWIDGFVESLTTISDHMKAHLRSSLAGVEWDRPVAEVREELVVIFQLECAQGAGMASALAAEFYDGIRERTVGSGIGAVASDRYADPVALEGAVRALVDPIAKAAPEGMPEAVGKVTDGLAERLGYEVKRAAGETLYDNARLDRRKPRFARVPRGSRSYPNGCPFCQMLASRGFAYVSEASAGALDPHHYHDDCRCAIVPSWDRSPEVEGYDPKAYDDGYREWQALRSVVEGKRRRLEAIEAEPDIVFANSVGADVFRDEVRIPAKITGLSHDIYTVIARGSRITGRKKIAGAGTNTPIHSELDSLKEEYPEVDRALWEKWAGNGVVEDLGIERAAHLHWYWSEETGRVRMKVDHFFR